MSTYVEALSEHKKCNGWKLFYIETLVKLFGKLNSEYLHAISFTYLPTSIV
jgi:hypothetical protein